MNHRNSHSNQHSDSSNYNQDPGEHANRIPWANRPPRRNYTQSPIYECDISNNCQNTNNDPQLHIPNQSTNQINYDVNYQSCADEEETVRPQYMANKYNSQNYCDKAQFGQDIGCHANRIPWRKNAHEPGLTPNLFYDHDTSNLHSDNSTQQLDQMTQHTVSINYSIGNNSQTDQEKTIRPQHIIWNGSAQFLNPSIHYQTQDFVTQQQMECFQSEITTVVARLDAQDNDMRNQMIGLFNGNGNQIQYHGQNSNSNSNAIPNNSINNIIQEIVVEVKRLGEENLKRIQENIPNIIVADLVAREQIQAIKSQGQKNEEAVSLRINTLEVFVRGINERLQGQSSQVNNLHINSLQKCKEYEQLSTIVGQLRSNLNSQKQLVIRLQSDSGIRRMDTNARLNPKAQQEYNHIINLHSKNDLTLKQILIYLPNLQKKLTNDIEALKHLLSIQQNQISIIASQKQNVEINHSNFRRQIAERFEELVRQNKIRDVAQKQLENQHIQALLKNQQLQQEVLIMKNRLRLSQQGSSPERFKQLIKELTQNITTSLISDAQMTLSNQKKIQGDKHQKLEKKIEGNQREQKLSTKQLTQEIGDLQFNLQSLNQKFNSVISSHHKCGKDEGCCQWCTAQYTKIWQQLQLLKINVHTSTEYIIINLLILINTLQTLIPNQIYNHRVSWKNQKKEITFERKTYFLDKYLEQRSNEEEKGTLMVIFGQQMKQIDDIIDNYIDLKLNVRYNKVQQFFNIYHISKYILLLY